MAKLIVKSQAFENNRHIPAKYTCDGDEVSPPLIVESVPPETKSLVLIVDDPDAPSGTFDHWVIWNISPTGKIEEHSAPGTEGLNSAGQRGYMGPCPPSGTHRYFFKVYALDAKLNLSPDARKRDVEKAMENHVLANGELIGLYRRSG